MEATECRTDFVLNFSPRHFRFVLDADRAVQEGRKVGARNSARSKEFHCENCFGRFGDYIAVNLYSAGELRSWGRKGTDFLLLFVLLFS